MGQRGELEAFRGRFEAGGMLELAAGLGIRGRDGQLARLVANTAQRLYEERRGRKNIVLKARQVGITTWVAARFFLLTVTRPGTLTVQVAHDTDSAEELFRIVHRFHACLDEELREGVLRASRANARQLVFGEIDSEYRVETAGDAEAGRGLTIQNLHCSELARWPGNPRETLAGLRAAVPPAGEIVLESTAQGAGGCFYEEWQRGEETGYVRHFFPWWMEPAYVAKAVEQEELTAEERELRHRAGLTLEQVGFRRVVQKSLRGLAPQEFAETAEECFLGWGECVFEAEVVERWLEECGEPAERRDGGRLQIWLPAVAAREYVIGVDAAGGGAQGDYACAQVIERETGLQCAELHGHFPPQELARRVAELAAEYGGALVAVERNNHGHGVLAWLQARGGTRLYEQDGVAGWLTTSASKEEAIAGMGRLLQGEAPRFRSRRLLRECRSFVRRENGSAGAVEGEHDDCVMAMAVALAAREERRGSRSGRLKLGTLPMREEI